MDGNLKLNNKIAAAMVALGACARLIPHPWNFTPMIAIGLYAGAKSVKIRAGILITILALLLSDAVIGFYRGMWYVYAASLLAVMAGRLIRNREGIGAVSIAAFTAGLLFFLTTNFVVWAGGPRYPHTAAGLAACYVAAVPFYQNQVLGDVFYTLALFGGHALISRMAQREPRVA
ncbi:MAG: DUF6580 family putative transport protein [Bryobacteraceae bacterium]